MFYCEKCQVKNDWPTGFRGFPTSYGKCEMCGNSAGCYDVISSALPAPKKKNLKKEVNDAST